MPSVLFVPSTLSLWIVFPLIQFDLDLRLTSVDVRQVSDVKHNVVLQDNRLDAVCPQQQRGGKIYYIINPEHKSVDFLLHDTSRAP